MEKIDFTQGVNMDEKRAMAPWQNTATPAPVITIMHASVGSGHKAAANAVAQAIDRMRGTNNVPSNVIVEVHHD